MLIKNMNTNIKIGTEKYKQTNTSIENIIKNMTVNSPKERGRLVFLYK